MTDIYCFTCRHEIRENWVDGWAHIHEDDKSRCLCIHDDLKCEP